MGKWGPTIKAWGERKARGRGQVVREIAEMGETERVPPDGKHPTDEGGMKQGAGSGGGPGLDHRERSGRGWLAVKGVLFSSRRQGAWALAKGGEGGRGTESDP